MIKVVFKVLFVAYVCLSVLSCTDDTDKPFTNNKVSYLPISDCDVHPLGDTLYFSYTSGENWKLRYDLDSEDVEWITIQPNGKRDGGYWLSGTTEIMVVVMPFYGQSGSQRESAVRFVDSEGHVLDSFNITQQRAVIEISEQSLTLPWKQKNTAFTVKSNIQWSVEIIGDKDSFAIQDNEDEIRGSIPPGFDFSKAESEVVTFTSNGHNMTADKQTRTAVIKIVPVKTRDGGNDKMTLTPSLLQAVGGSVSVSQDYLIFEIVDEYGNSIEEISGFNELGYDFMSSDDNYFEHKQECTKKYQVRIEEGYTFVDDSDLIKADVTKEEIDAPSYKEGDRKVNVVENTLVWKTPSSSTSDRTCKEFNVWIIDENGVEVEGTRHNLKLYQNPYQFALMENGSSIGGYTKQVHNLGDTLAFSIQTTGPWALCDANNTPIDNLPDWINFTQTLEDGTDIEGLKGYGTSTVKMQIPSQNLCFADNNERVWSGYKICSTLGNGMEIPINVTQDPFVFRVKYSDESVENPSLKTISRWENNNIRVSVTSSGPWRMDIRDPMNVESGNWLSSEVREGGACEDFEFTLNAASYDDMTFNGYREKSLDFQSKAHSNSNENYGGKDQVSLKFRQQSLSAAIMRSSGSEELWHPSIWPAYKGDASGNPLPNEQTFYAQISAPWEFIPGEDCNWIKLYDNNGSLVTESDGREYATYGVRLDTNDGNNVRRGSFIIRVHLEENYDIPFEIEQSACDFNVSYGGVDIKSGETFDVAAVCKNSMEFEVNTPNNAPWKVEAQKNSAGMLDISSGNRYGTQTWTIRPSDNTSLTDEREAELVFTNLISNASYKVTLNQDKYIWSVGDFNKPLPSMFNELDDSEYTCEILSTQDLVLNVLDGQVDWLDKYEPTKGSNIYTIKPKKNFSDKTRTCTYELVSYQNLYFRRFVLNQQNYRFDVEAETLDNVEFGPLEDIGTKNIAVYCSSDITATMGTVSPWNQILGDFRNVQRTLTINNFQVPNNYTGESVSYSVVVKSVDYSADGEASRLKKEIGFTRAPYMFDVSQLPSDKLNVTSAKYENTFMVTCSGELNVSVPSYATVTKTTQDDVYMISVSIPENTTNAQKHTTIIISSADYIKGDTIRNRFYHEFEIIQEKASVEP